MIAVSANITSEQLPLQGTSDLEYVCVKLTLNRFVVIIYCLYIKPNSQIDIFQGHIDQLNNIVYGTMLVIGDFNLPNIDWTRNGDENNFIATNVTNATANLLFDYMEQHNIRQLNHLPNIYGNLLDLCYSSDIYCVQISEAEAPISGVDIAHRPFIATIELVECVPFALVDAERQFSFHCADFDAMNESFNAIDLNLMSSFDTNAATELLYDHMMTTFQRFVPTATHQSNNNPPWFKLINLKNRKNKAYTRFKASGNRAEYETARAEFDALNRYRYEIHLEQIQVDLTYDPKKFWQ